MTAPKDAAAAESAATASASGTPAPGLDRVLETSKWLIAAIATVLLAGFQFASVLPSS